MLINEILITIFSASFFIYTDLVKDMKIKLVAEKAIMISIFAIQCLNLGFIIGDSLFSLLKCRRKSRLKENVASVIHQLKTSPA